MPPRYAYWTILIDDKPTAFRAREREELLPTLQQLKHTNPNAVMKWFARGKLWDTREQEQAVHKWRKTAEAESLRSRPRDGNAGRASGGGAPREKDKQNRGRDWRPGGEHRDPRARFDKRHRDKRAAGVGVTPERHGAKASASGGGAPRDFKEVAHKDPRARFDKRKKDRRAGLKGQPEGDRRPWRDKPAGPPRGARPSRPPGDRPPGPPKDRRPWQTARPEGDRRPWRDRPAGPPRGDRPWRDKPAGPPRGDRPQGDRRPWGNKPSGLPREGGRPPDRRGAWEKKPAGQGDRKPWQKNARGSKRDRPRVDLPGRRIPGVGGSGPPVQNEPSKRREEPKRRDESPDKPPAPEQIVTKPKPPERG